MPRLGGYLDELNERYGDDYQSVLRQLAWKYSKKNINILEFGAGGSTRTFAEVADECDGWLLTIDNDKAYMETVSSALRSHRIDFRVVDIDGPRESRGDTDYNYASMPLALGRQFDLIYVDGRRRVECTLTAALVASPDAVVIVHDHERARYRAIRELFSEAEIVGQFLVLKAAKLAARRLPRQHSTAIFQVVGGANADHETMITGPSVAAYCAKIGADHNVLSLPNVPKAALKFAARPHFAPYDRVCLLDTDIVIRPTAPNIFDVVPSDSIGAWRQDRAFQQMSSVLNREIRTYTGNKRHAPAYYVNTGVLVMSRAQYDFLDFPSQPNFMGHPLFENSYLSVKLFDENRPFFNLPPDFNFIPHPDLFMDQRYGYFVHLAGAGKAQNIEYVGWSLDDEGFGSRWLRRTQIRNRHTRLPRLRAVALNAEGRESVAFDPTDLTINGPSYIELDDGIARLRIVPAEYDWNIAAYGPYAPLKRGRYKMSIDGLRATGNVKLDVFHAGSHSFCMEFNVEAGAVCEFETPVDLEAFQVRFHPSGDPYDFTGVVLERLPDAPGDLATHPSKEQA